LRSYLTAAYSRERSLSRRSVASSTKALEPTGPRSGHVAALVRVAAWVMQQKPSRSASCSAMRPRQPGHYFPCVTARDRCVHDPEALVELVDPELPLRSILAQHARDPFAVGVGDPQRRPTARSLASPAARHDRHYVAIGALRARRDPPTERRSVVWTKLSPALVENGA
jgi:hypothetical protein